MSSFCSYVAGTWGGCGGMLVLGALLALPLIFLGYMSARRSARSDFVALQRLNALGVDLTQPRDIHFLFFLRTRPSAEHIAHVLGEEYTCEVEEGTIKGQVPGENEPREETGYLLHARARMVPDGSELTRLRLRFAKVALENNGYYIGWDTSRKLFGA